MEFLGPGKIKRWWTQLCFAMEDLRLLCGFTMVFVRHRIGEEDREKKRKRKKYISAKKL